MRTTSRRSSLSRLWARLTGQTEVTRGRSARLVLTNLEDRTVPAVVFSDSYELTGPQGNAIVELTVTPDAPGYSGLYLWNYHVINETFDVNGSGIGVFQVELYGGPVGNVGNNAGWPSDSPSSGGPGGVVTWGPGESGTGVGQSDDFWFTTSTFGFRESSLTVGDSSFAATSSSFSFGPGDRQLVSVERLADATEGEESGKVLFTRLGDTSGSLTVSYSLGGTANSGVDYDTPTGTVTFAPGSATATLSIAPKIDGAVEGNETVAVTLGTGTGYTAGSPSSATLSIIDVPPGSVSGTVWVDADANGVKDASEGTLSGVTVSLLDASGSPAKNADGTTVGSVTSGPGGTYSFGNLFPQGYILQFTAPSGYVLSGSSNTEQQVVLITSGQTQTIDQAVYGGSQLSTVSGLILAYLDPGQSGPVSGLAGVAVSLLSGSTVVASTTTGGSGAYAFPNLTPGTYSAQFTAPSGYRFSSSGQSTLTAGVSTPGPLSTLNVEAYQPASLSGTAWVDANQDGQVSSGESGLAGVTVEVLDDAWAAVTSATTASGGLYSITGLAPGSYRLLFTAPGGYSLSGSSNVLFGHLYVGSGGSATRNAAAFTSTQSSAIFGRVWTDADGNGVQDAGESGLSGVGVAVKSNGTTVATTSTNASGDYSVAGLPPGTYTVQLTAPTGYVLAASRATVWSTEVGTPGPSAVVNAAAYQPASVSGTVWVDTDNDGVKDAGETAIDGATVSFYGRDSTVAGTATANASGDYSAANLPPDVYRVVVEAPANFALNGMPAAVKVPLVLPSGGNVVLPVAFNNAAPAKNKIKFELATGKEFFDKLNTAVNGGGKAAKDIADRQFKQDMGIDIANPADQAKWAKETLFYGVVKDATGKRVSGGAGNAVRLSVDDYANAPQKNKASITQVLEYDVRFFDVNGEQIAMDVYHQVESFAVDANGVSKTLDLHSAAYPVNHVFQGKTVTKVEVVLSFVSGWGIYKNKPQPAEFAITPILDDPPAANDIEWLGTTASYKMKWRLNAVDGKWTFDDTCIPNGADGVDNIINK